MGGREGEHCVAAWADLSLLAPLFGGRLISSPHAPLLSTRRPLSPRGEGERERERECLVLRKSFGKSHEALSSKSSSRESSYGATSVRNHQSSVRSGAPTHRPAAAPIRQQHPSHSSTHPTAAPIRRQHPSDGGPTQRGEERTYKRVQKTCLIMMTSDPRR